MRGASVLAATLALPAVCACAQQIVAARGFPLVSLSGGLPAKSGPCEPFATNLH
jgi:hypothetical protein